MSHLALILPFVLFSVLACNDSDDDTDTGTGYNGPGDAGADATADAATPSGDPWPLLDGGAGEGESCINHVDCQTQYCLRFSDVPFDDKAVCEEATVQGEMRLTATVRDLITGAAVKGATTRVVGAFAAASNPVAAKALAFGVGTSNDKGRIDTVAKKVNGTALGLVGLTEKEGYYLSATGLVGPLPESTDYAPGNSIHDLWLVSEDTLTSWSEALEGDADLEDLLPLGEAGGVIAFVRDAKTGAGLKDAVMVSELGAKTKAQIRYLAADGETFAGESTSSLGIAVILGANVGEGFAAFVGEDKVDENVAGSAKNAIMVIALQ